ncbi:aspartyl protease family protein [Pseudomonas syringae]|uniref:aspartyl protease family protein n=1 Tax=Pseudomonas syringae TaxID=317 RepID=UPI001F101957|nr:hypothetical protein [Pseudomonas syringae]MCH5555698.1 hypothetical protein [Pseudomonas syringae pv. syringae]MCH5576318.1 hypothetical protein [Pseudomonas syringae pv. syringae]MCH5668465.1 hypothetical protein [Pseudomonas syringae pv. syringae]
MRPKSVIENNVVRIKFINKNGALSNTPVEVNLIPVIPFSVRQQLSDGTFSNPVAGLALVDTGADHSAIDSKFAESAGFQSCALGSPLGVGGIVYNAPCYDLRYTINTPDRPRLYDARFVGVPLRDDDQRYQVILGMSFIQRGRLIMDFEAEEFLFEFYPAS